jgi:hypothetical protein
MFDFWRLSHAIARIGRDPGTKRALARSVYLAKRWSAYIRSDASGARVRRAPDAVPAAIEMIVRMKWTGVHGMQSVSCGAARREDVGTWGGGDRRDDRRKNAFGRNGCPGAALWGLNRSGSRDGRGLWPRRRRRGSRSERSAPAAGRPPGRPPPGRAVLRSCDKRWRHTSPGTRRARRHRSRAPRARAGRAGHEVSGSAGQGWPRSHARVAIICPSAQTGHGRSELPMRDS